MSDLQLGGLWLDDVLRGMRLRQSDAERVVSTGWHYVRRGRLPVLGLRHSPTDDPVVQHRRLPSRTHPACMAERTAFRLLKDVRWRCADI
jgi:hypothetical protein